MRSIKLPVYARTMLAHAKYLGNGRKAARALIDATSAIKQRRASTITAEQDDDCGEDAWISATARSNLIASLERTFRDMGRNGWDHWNDGVVEENMCIALLIALEKAIVSGTDSEETSGDTSSEINAHAGRKRKRSRRTCETDTGEKEQLEAAARKHAMIENCALITESLMIQVSSRTCMRRGRHRKVYEMFRLPSTTRHCSEAGLAHLRRALHSEFRLVYDQSQCRVYALLRKLKGDRLCRTAGNVDDDSSSDEEEGGETVLFLQFCIGALTDVSENEMRSKTRQEFSLVLRTGTDLIALTSGFHCRSKKMTRYILAAVSAALCSVDVRSSRNVQLKSSMLEVYSYTAISFGDMTSTDPLALLSAALAVQNRSAVGRFSRMDTATFGNSADPMVVHADPLVEMNDISTGNLIGRKKEMKQRSIACRHGLEVADLSSNIDFISNGNSSLVGVNNSGVIVDHSVSHRKKLKRAALHELGEKGDCPKLQYMRWKWKGNTLAAHNCWNEEYWSTEETDSPPSTQNPTEFKCAVTLEGDDIFEGLRTLMAAGIVKPPLPSYVRDAPSIGSSTISVENGRIT